MRTTTLSSDLAVHLDTSARFTRTHSGRIGPLKIYASLLRESQNVCDVLLVSFLMLLVVHVPSGLILL